MEYLSRSSPVIGPRDNLLGHGIDSLIVLPYYDCADAGALTWINEGVKNWTALLKYPRLSRIFPRDVSLPPRTGRLSTMGHWLASAAYSSHCSNELFYDWSKSRWSVNRAQVGFEKAVSNVMNIQIFAVRQHNSVSAPSTVEAPWMIMQIAIQ